MALTSDDVDDVTYLRALARNLFESHPTTGRAINRAASRVDAVARKLAAEQPVDEDELPATVTLRTSELLDLLGALFNDVRLQQLATVVEHLVDAVSSRVGIEVATDIPQSYGVTRVPISALNSIRDTDD